MKNSDLVIIEESVMKRIQEKVQHRQGVETIEMIKEALVTGLSNRVEGRVYEGAKQNEFEMFSMLCEAVASLDEVEASKAAKSVDGTGIQLFDLPNGNKGVAIRSNGKYTFVGGEEAPVVMSEAEWNKMEKELIDSGAKNVSNPPNPSKWVVFLKASLKVATTVVKILIVSGILILAFKALLPITTGLFTGFAQYTPWGGKLLSADGLELFKQTIGAEMRGKWLVAKAKQAVLGGSFAGQLAKTIY